MALSLACLAEERQEVGTDYYSAGTDYYLAGTDRWACCLSVRLLVAGTVDIQGKALVVEGIPCQDRASRRDCMAASDNLRLQGQGLDTVGMGYTCYIAEGASGSHHGRRCLYGDARDFHYCYYHYYRA